MCSWQTQEAHHVLGVWCTKSKLFHSFVHNTATKMQRRYDDFFMEESLTSDLTEEQSKQLHDLLGNVELTLLYKASVHGYKASAFHKRCDRQGPTLLVAYNHSGYIFGGYTSVDYTRNEQYITDEEAFLFSFQGKFPVYIKVNSGHYARYGNAGMPNFGQQLYFCKNNQPVVYIRGGKSFSFNAERFYGNDTVLTECEVYKVKQSKSVIRKSVSCCCVK